jgi:hypothetical protein
MASNNNVAFRVAGYDPKRALVVDPVLSYSTYLGGSGNDEGYGIAVDSSGNAYVAGYTGSTDFPTANPLQAKCDNCGYLGGDAFVAKLNPAGSALVYSTYLDGSDLDGGVAIAVDSAGSAYVTGTTWSADFPTAHPLQVSCDNCSRTNGDGFVAKLSPAGSTLVYSTYLGGSSEDSGHGIAVDAADSAYVTGITASTDFPTVNPLQAANKTANGDGTAFVAKLNAAGSALVYSTYLGGSYFDQGNGIAVDDAGNAYVAGGTESTDFPTANPLQPSYGGTVASSGSGDAFVAKISPVVILSPTNFTFGPQNVGTTSTPQTVTVTNTGSANLTILTVTIGGANASDFAKSADACAGATVTAKGSCTVSVTFTPSAIGSRSASLRFADNVPDSPQSVELNGTGQDFTLAASSGSSTSATVAPGQSATYTLTMTGEGGFNQSVSLTCTGAPSEATCTVPTPVTAGSSGTNVTVSVTTTAASGSMPRSRPFPPAPTLPPGLRGLLILALALGAMAWAMGRRNQPGVSRWRSTMVPLAAGLLLTLALAGCGGGGSSTSTPPPNPGTPAGTYTLTVTGTVISGSSTLIRSVTLTLTVS